MRSLPSKWKAMFLDDGDGEREEKKKKTQNLYIDFDKTELLLLYIYMYVVEFTHILYHPVMPFRMYYLCQSISN